MNYFDLHCDTLTACYQQKTSLLQNDGQLDLQRGIEVCEKWVQTFAVFVPDELRGEEAWNYYRAVYAYFHQQIDDAKGLLTLKGSPSAGKCRALLSIEGGAVLGGKLSRIEQLAEDGVSIFGITWNGANELSGGIATGGGLTPLGREAVLETRTRRHFAGCLPSVGRRGGGCLVAHQRTGPCNPFQRQSTLRASPKSFGCSNPADCRCRRVDRGEFLSAVCGRGCRRLSIEHTLPPYRTFSGGGISVHSSHRQ